MPYKDSRETDAVRKEIVQYIKDYIRQEHLSADSRLPSENKLAAQFHTDRNTVRGALTALRLQGIIYSEKGRGFFVEKHNESLSLHIEKDLGLSEALSRDRKQNSIDLLQVSRRSANKKEESILLLSPGEEIYKLDQLRYMDGKPFAVCTSIIPAHFVPHLEDRLKEQEQFDGTTRIFTEMYSFPHPILRSISLETHLPASADLSLLHLPEGIPLLIQRNVYELFHNVPVEYFEIRARSDMYKITIDLD